MPCQIRPFYQDHVISFPIPSALPPYSVCTRATHSIPPFSASGRQDLILWCRPWSCGVATEWSERHGVGLVNSIVSTPIRTNPGRILQQNTDRMLYTFLAFLHASVTAPMINHRCHTITVDRCYRTYHMELPVSSLPAPGSGLGIARPAISHPSFACIPPTDRL